MLGLIIAVIFFGVIGVIVYVIYSIWKTIEPYATFVFDNFKKLCEIVMTLEGAIQGPILSVINTIGGSVGNIEGLVNKIIGLVANLAGGAGGAIAGAAKSLASGLSSLASDSRVKENMSDADMNELIARINRLQFKNYNYINKNHYKGKKVYGLVAQDVILNIPEAVNLVTDYLPNIMKYSNSINVVEDKVVINVEHNNVLKVGDIIKLVIDNHEISVNVIDLDDNNITVNMWNKLDTTKKVLVYGKQVDDFHTLDASYLGILALGGVQELYKMIALLKQDNENLKLQIKNI